MYGKIIEWLNECQMKKMMAQGYTQVGVFLNKDGSLMDSYRWHTVEKRKYVNIDCGTSGYYMVDKTDGEIYNIKAYGQIDKNKKLKSNLGNIRDYDSLEKVERLFGLKYNYWR